LTFEEGGNPVESNRIIVGWNPLLVDSYCAGLIGYRTDEVEYLIHGRELGLGGFYSADTKVVELNPENKPIRASRIADRYSKYIVEDSACSACYSALVYALHRSRGRVSGKIHIGQGFNGKQGEGLGVGSCCCGFLQSVPGCSPKAVDILEMLQKLN
jgi:hypothetical protein